MSIFQFMLVSAVAMSTWRDYSMANYGFMAECWNQTCDCIIVPLFAWALASGRPRAALRSLGGIARSRRAAMTTGTSGEGGQEEGVREPLMIPPRRRRAAAMEAEENRELHPRVPPTSSLLVLDVWLLGKILRFVRHLPPHGREPLHL